MTTTRTILLLVVMAAVASGERCTTVSSSIPHCGSMQTTAPLNLTTFIKKVNSLNEHNLAMRVGDNTYCETTSCIQSAKGLLCLAMNGGVAYNVPRDILGTPPAKENRVITLPQFSKNPPLSGIAIRTGIPIMSSDSPDGDSSLLDIHIPDSLSDSAFCVNGIESREHPPCFTQCMDLLTPMCSIPCSAPGVNPLLTPCVDQGPTQNPICVIRASQEYKLDVRFEPWASCFKDPFLSPTVKKDGGQVCAGRVPVNHVYVSITFFCTDIFTGVCGNPAAIYKPLDDPFSTIAMSLSDFLGINPIGIRKPVKGTAFTTEDIPFVPNGLTPDRVVTVHMDLYADEGGDAKIPSLKEPGAAKVLETHFRSQMILPYGIDVHGVSVTTSASTRTLQNWVLTFTVYIVASTVAILMQMTNHRPHDD